MTGPISPLVTWAGLGVRSGSQQSTYDLVPNYAMTPISATCRLQDMGQVVNLSSSVKTQTPTWQDCQEEQMR